MNAERPYPEDIAWDEAWHQRQRADAMERERNELARALFAIRDTTMWKGGRTQPMQQIAEIACGAVADIDEGPLFPPASEASEEMERHIKEG